VRNSAAYSASKFALTGFTQALYEEVKDFNIRCSVIYPGGMNTRFAKRLTIKDKSEFLQPKDVGKFLYHKVNQAQNFVVNEVVVTPLVEELYP
jgi:short-subunit dehydrogenase